MTSTNNKKERQVTSKKNPLPQARFIPRWSGPIEGYAVNAIRRAYPTLSPEYEFEDLLQEAYIKYMKCVRTYRGRVDNAAWFMALYKCSLNNHLVGLVQRCSRYNFLEYRESFEFEMAGTMINEAEILRLLKALPTDLLTVLELLLAGVRKGVPLKKVKELRTFILQERAT